LSSPSSKSFGRLAGKCYKGNGGAGEGAGKDKEVKKGLMERLLEEEKFDFNKNK